MLDIQTEKIAKKIHTAHQVAHQGTDMMTMMDVAYLALSLDVEAVGVAVVIVDAEVVADAEAVIKNKQIKYYGHNYNKRPGF